MNVGQIIWRKSSHSGSAQTSDCVEVAPLVRTTGVRDSKAPALGHLEVAPDAWGALLDHLKVGR